MPAVANKYDPECATARASAKARGAVLIIVGGDRGSGFSVQSVDHTLEDSLPILLRSLAAQIEEDSAGLRGETA